MATYFNISIIGSGNLAWHLAQVLENTGHTIHEVYSRSSENAKALIGKLYEARLQENLDFSASPSEIFIVSVSDQAIEEVADKLILPEGAILVHTSGTTPMEKLGDASQHTGVFYPLQTFSKTSRIDFRKIPLLIEGSDNKTEKILMALARSVSKTIRRMTSKEREIVHVAAVFASNFTNHLLGIAGEILQRKKLDFELLEPLIVETIHKGLDLGPKNAQTGPAARQDLQVLDRHMAFLSYDPSLQDIYKVISQHIIDSHYQD